MAILLPSEPVNKEVVFDTSPELVNRKPWFRTGATSKEKPILWLRWGAVAVGVLLVLLVLTLGMRALLRAIREEDSGYARDSKAYGFRFQFPDHPWTQDPRTQKDLKASFALRRSDPEARMVLLVHDFRDHSPKEAELLQEARTRLREYFQDFHGEKRGENVLGGLRGPVMDFTGEVKGIPMEGECFMVTQNQIGYWFVTWSAAADRELAAPSWDQLRARLVIGK